MAITGKQTLASNPFSAVFKYRPRRGTTAKENFLTEALVYSLRQSKPGARRWVERVTEGKITPATVQLATQSRLEHQSKAHGISDVLVTGKTKSGRQYILLVEHKWDARVSTVQLKRYTKWLGRKGLRHLALVYANDRDREVARRFAGLGNVGFSSCTWEEVYRELKRVAAPPIALQNLLTFLEDVELSPGKPLTKASLILCAQRKTTGSSPVRQQLQRYCTKLDNQFEWAAIPNFFKETYVSDSWGRCAVCFLGNTRGPEMSFGFYYNKTDHRLALLNPKEGIDLALRLLAPAKKNAKVEEVVIARLRKAVPRLQKLGATVHLRGDIGNGNPWTLFIARTPLWRAISGATTEAEQIDRIHDHLKSWSRSLFSDPQVMTELRTLRM